VDAIKQKGGRSRPHIPTTPLRRTGAYFVRFALAPIRSVLAALGRTGNHRAAPRRAVVIFAGMGTTHGPLRTVRISVSAAMRAASDSSLRAESNDGRTDCERRANQIPSKFLQGALHRNDRAGRLTIWESE
jgi:hypothetical protein